MGIGVFGTGVGRIVGKRVGFGEGRNVGATVGAEEGRRVGTSVGSCVIGAGLGFGVGAEEGGGNDAACKMYSEWYHSEVLALF